MYFQLNNHCAPAHFKMTGLTYNIKWKTKWESRNENKLRGKKEQRECNGSNTFHKVLFKKLDHKCGGASYQPIQRGKQVTQINVHRINVPTVQQCGYFWCWDFKKVNQSSSRGYCLTLKMKDPTTSTGNNKGNFMLLPSGYNLPQQATLRELMQSDTCFSKGVRPRKK